MNRVGIYIHIPFCTTRCRYCDFYKVGYTYAREKDFVQAVEKELVCRSCEVQEYIVDSIYIGGGTPSLLSFESLDRILNVVNRCYSINLDDIEISIETNPVDLNRERINFYKFLGINRVSVGVQSFSECELKVLGRRENVANIMRVLEMLLDSEFTVNADFIIGIPGQKKNSIFSTLEVVKKLSPDHLSFYMLEIHKNTEFELLYRDKKLFFPTDEELAENYLLVSEFLESIGYEHYEISNFSKNGKRCRHNLKYWHFLPWLGFGPSAFSYFKEKYFYHPRSLSEYSQNPLAVKKSFPIGKKERTIMKLRTKEGIPVSEVALPWEKVSLLEESGYLTANDRIALTPAGWLLFNELLVYLDLI